VFENGNGFGNGNYEIRNPKLKMKIEIGNIEKFERWCDVAIERLYMVG
jgi:hypothetical protein